MGLHGFALWLYLGELALYLAVGGVLAARVRWRRRRFAPPRDDVQRQSAATTGRAETIASAAAGNARLEVVEGSPSEEVTLPAGLTMQRRVILDRRSLDEPPATITVTIH